MISIRLASTLAALVTVLSGQGPILHYHFNEGGSPLTTDNIGSFMPGPSPLIGHTLTATGANGTPCLTGAGGATSEVTTPLTVALGNASWTIGFSIKNASPGGFQYVMSENLTTGWRIFTGGGAGAGNIRMTGTTLPNVDLAGGAGDSGWVHVAFVHDTVANLIHAYLNGALVSSTAAPSINLTSGNSLLLGRNGTTCLLPGTQVDDFRLYDYPLDANAVDGWAQGASSRRPDFSKVMLSEVSWINPRGIEVTNHGLTVTSLTNWTIKWINGSTVSPSTVFVSNPINLSVAPGESIVVMAGATAEPFPAGTQVVNRFPGGITGVFAAYTVALLDPIGTVIDEVHLSDAATTFVSASAGGRFRGLALHASGPGNRSVERIWGLDSDGGSDWTEQVTRTLGRENTSDGMRGTDPIAVPVVRINEIDDNPDYVELYNPTASPVMLSDWFLLMSSAQGSGHSRLTIPPGASIPANGYIVIGDTPVAPAELPVTITYLNIGAILYTNAPLDCALYDDLGRLVDLVRAPSAQGQNVHNFSRAPSHWSDFVGSAGRNNNGGDDAFGRGPSSSDTNSGADFFPLMTRTMGFANASNTQAGPAGHGDVLDVRLNETGLGQGFQAILNAGPSASNLTYNFMVSAIHSNGVGPFLGLGGDALANFPAFYHVQPFWGLLNAAGSGRIEFNPGSLPPGVNADFVFFLQNGANSLVRRTFVLEFDT